ncbi:MAG: hypothetical protein ACQES1_01775 [Bacteroidota bacterium]
MTPEDAFYFAMSKIKELEKDGIDITITPSQSKDDQELINKFCTSDKIPPELWHNICFRFTDKARANKIQKLASYLAMCGISFDIGGTTGLRDWEFDWSFSYNEGENKREWIKAGKRVEDMINKLSRGKNK